MRKLARASDCLSFLVLSTRIAYMGISRRHFPRVFFSLSLSVVFSFFLFCALASTNCIFLPFHPSSFYLLFCLFPHFLYPHRRKVFAFFSSSSSLLRFFLLHQLWGSILCHATEQTIGEEGKKEKKKKNEEEKLSLLLPSSLYAFISIFFSLHTQHTQSKKKLNSCSNQANRKLIIFSKNFICYSRSCVWHWISIKKIPCLSWCLSNRNIMSLP